MQAYIAEAERAKRYPGKIVTQIVPLRTFYPARTTWRSHPTQPCIVYNDAPKLAHLREHIGSGQWGGYRKGRSGVPLRPLNVMTPMRDDRPPTPPSG